eukprot:PITA_18003
MEEGKLLGHIISKDGIRIDPARVQAIQQIDLPQNKKEIQSFNGKMNFLRRFVPNLTEHLREMTNMLKKDSQMKWTEEAVKSFNLVKLALSSAPVLVSPDYTQDFILFSFASEHTMATVLLQKRDDHERPIAFFSRAIRDAALKYNIIEKQVLALVKALKYFWVYILHSHVLAYVPNATVKDVLVQADLEGRRGKWIAALLEYDVEINPTKLVKGQGLAKLMAESNLHALDINLIAALSNENDEEPPIQVSEMFSLSPWYSDIIYVLKNLSPPPGMTRNKARTLKLKATKFCILNSTLYWKDPDGIFLNCLVEKEANISFLSRCPGCQTSSGGRQRRRSHAEEVESNGPLAADQRRSFQEHIQLQEKIKKIYDRKAKVDKLQVDDVVLKWDARNEEKGKHDKFENLWKGPFKIAAYHGQNAFLLKEINGEDCPGGPINGRLLKRYHF